MPAPGAAPTPNPFVILWTVNPSAHGEYALFKDVPASMDNECFGPVGGYPAYHLEAHGFVPKTLAIFADEGCAYKHVSSCEDCKALVVDWNATEVSWGM